MNIPIKDLGYQDKLSNTSQWGGIETAVIDNGLGRGTRIAWINTGTGLRYKVVIDRAMDIADAFYHQYSLSWISPTGILPPARFADKGTDWLKNFGGGLLTTCGLTHVGGPELEGEEARGVHGAISNVSAEIIAVEQPRPLEGKMNMSITGIIKEAKVFGPVLELRRTISGTLGQPHIKISDEVINLGNTPCPHMLLYHYNLGWPLINKGTTINWEGKWTAREKEHAVLFKEGNPFKTCTDPIDSHNGGGEEAAFIDVKEDSNGMVNCGVYNPQLQFGLELTYKKEELPCLTNWLHYAKGEYVVGLEPGTNPPIGQSKAKKEGSLIYLQPGEKRQYTTKIEIREM